MFDQMDRFEWIILAILTVLNLACYVGLAYVVFHFVSRFW